MEKILEDRASAILRDIDSLMVQNQALINTKELLISSMKNYSSDIAKLEKNLDTVTNAVAILSSISDETISMNYKFIEENINAALKLVFPDKTRIIKLSQYMRGQYPQLELRIEVEDGVIRTIKSDSGHGIAQIISILTILCLIVIKGERRFLALDEMTSGMSGNTRKLLDSILWSFADIGFQIVLVDHGYIPQGAHTYILKSDGKTGKVISNYVEDEGIYNEGLRNKDRYRIGQSE